MKRKLKVKNLIILIAVFCSIVTGIVLLGIDLIKKETTYALKPTSTSSVTAFLDGKNIIDFILSPKELGKLDINKLYDEDYFSYKNTKELPIKINSSKYMIVDLNKRDVMYAYGIEDVCYPASLTKLLTLDTLLNCYKDNLDDVSSFTLSQKELLVKENASLAYIKPDTDYTLNDLCYALILPSGADAASAIENYFRNDGRDLIVEMNAQATNLGLKNTHIVNSTGLDDAGHYVCVEDVFKIVWDLLKYSKGKEILSTLSYTLSDGFVINSTLASLGSIENVDILGGKTGFTSLAKENIFVYFGHDDEYYVLILTGADGNPYNDEYYHFDDVKKIINYFFS